MPSKQKRNRALDVKCPTCRSNPGARCDGASPCAARTKLAQGTSQGRIDALERRLENAISRIKKLEETKCSDDA